MHPAIRILGLVLLAIAVQGMPLANLLVTLALVLGVAFFLHGVLLRTMLRRARWLLLTLMLIFSMTTPGEYVHGWPLAFAPTYEGLIAGTVQAARLLTMLAGLSLLLGTTGRGALMAGLYVLLLPLKALGVATERFTARLWLTLHYVEAAPRQDASHRWQLLQDWTRLENSSEERVVPVQLHIPALTWRDGLAVGVLLVGLLAWLS